jgi:hypothetical protein
MEETFTTQISSPKLSQVLSPAFKKKNTSDINRVVILKIETNFWTITSCSNCRVGIAVPSNLNYTKFVLHEAIMNTLVTQQDLESSSGFTL